MLIKIMVSKFGRNLAQTLTPVSKFGRVLVETSTKLRPNSDTPNVEVWSKFDRYMNKPHCKVKVLDQMSTKLRRQTVTKLRHPQCRSLVEMSTKLRHPRCRSLVEMSTKLRPNFDTPSVEVLSNCVSFGQIVDTC